MTSYYDQAEQAAETYSPEPGIPADWPVQPLDGPGARHGATQCGGCGRWWDDSVSTELTPAPSARCPFEPFHADPEPEVPEPEVPETRDGFHLVWDDSGVAETLCSALDSYVVEVTPTGGDPVDIVLSFIGWSSEHGTEVIIGQPFDDDECGPDNDAEALVFNVLLVDQVRIY